MASYQQLFEIGESLAGFVSRGLEAEIGAVDSIVQKLSEPSCIGRETLERLEGVMGRYHLLVAGEMWCPDCQINIPVLDFMCRLQPRVRMSIISKGRAEDDMQTRLGLERISVPLVVILDGDFEPVGLFIERPRQVIEGGEGLKPDYRAGRFLEQTLCNVLDIIEGAEGKRAG